jgi:alpha-glucoside transport system substrate-binding protein
MRTPPRRLAAIGGLCALALMTTGCLSSGGDSGGSGGGGGGGGGVAADGGTKDGDKTIDVIGAFGGVEKDSFEKEMATLKEQTGITVNYTGTQDFQTIISSKVRSGDTPDIGIFPQPGTLTKLGEDGDVAPIGDYLDEASLKSATIPGLLDAGAGKDGTFYGAPMRVAVKSLVFVPKKPYADGGYSTSPKTVQELEGIADKIKAKGIAPWCIAYGSDAATGWVGTDWIEEFMLRINGPEVYDQWVKHEIPFDDPKVQAAFDAYGKIALTKGNVRGGADAIINTPFAEAGTPAFDDPPKCMMQRQGNFITGFFPDDVQKNLDNEVDVFYFPPYEGGYAGNPVLGGGDLAASFNSDDPDTKKVMEFISGKDFGKKWAPDGGWLSPRTDFDASLYPDETTRKVAKITSSADVFRFDASDLMPTEVGGGSFWKGMVEWTKGEKSTADVTKEIEDSWPSS